MYDWTNITLPKLTDYFNNSSRNIAQVFTVAWIEFLGAWFFAFVIAVLASALYTKTRKAITPIAFLVICNLLLGAVLPDNFIYIVGLIVATALGFILYQLFVKED